MSTASTPAATTRPTVVYIGIEWSELPESFSPQAKLEIKAGIERAMTELGDLGYDAHWCGVGLDPATAVSVVRRALEGRSIACVLVGAGLRKTDAALLLFEAVLNQVHSSCPGAALCFNSIPGDSAAAVQRWVRP
jgi:hypothetical protein